jgi:glycosyltransferase involved in cell wall biosynthesis
MWDGWLVQKNAKTAVIRSVTPVGQRPVSALQTSTKTFVAGGFLAHNTSALPEFASLGKPVVWMNAPWYRRGMNHGGRFWEWPAGQVQVDAPTELAAAVEAALEDPPAVAEARAAMLAKVYVATDGKATERAVAAIAAMQTKLAARFSDVGPGGAMRG